MISGTKLCLNFFNRIPFGYFRQICCKKMIKFNALHFMKNETFYHDFYSLNAFQVCGILTSFVNVIAVTPILFLIIWFERFGTNHNRSLINQFVTSTCWCGIAFNIFGQIPEIIISIFGPFHENFCFVHIIVKNAILGQFVILLTGISVVKYTYIFITKNPSGHSDDFICFFINLACGFNSLMSQFVIHFMPGNNSHPYYFCSGTLPGKHL